MTTTRGRRNPALLQGPAASGAPAPSPTDAERLAAQREAVAAAEALMQGELQEQLDSEPDAPTEEPAEPEPTPEERYEARLKAMEPDEVRWKVGLRAKNMQVEGYPLSIGDIVPGADAWPRRGAWESAGYIERA